VTRKAVHSALPERLEAAVGEVLDAAGVSHVAHGDRDAMAAAEAAAGDGRRARRPVDPPVWLWHADGSWALRADRPL